MLSEKGQSTAEILAITMIVLFLLSLVIAIVNQKNSETELISDTADSLIQCNALSETISNLYINRARTEIVVTPESDTSIKRRSGVPGLITVGGSTCHYVGIVEDDNIGAGINLTASAQYKFWKDNGGVKVCAMPC